MGLDELVDDRSFDTEEETETEDDIDNPVNNDGTIDLDQVYSHDPDNGVEYGKDKKCCPHCMEVVPMVRRRTYTCDNHECGVINFTAGWFERPGWRDFFPSIDFAELFDDD